MFSAKSGDKKTAVRKNYSVLSRLMFAVALSTFFVSGACENGKAVQVAQADDNPKEATIWTTWHRGDSRYGPNYIRLDTACQNLEDSGCSCTVRFVTVSDDFANYISSFGENKVPVVYQIVRAKDGRVRSARFMKVGTWTRDKFSSSNDGLLGIQVKSGSPGRQVNAVSVPDACFSPQ